LAQVIIAERFQPPALRRGGTCLPGRPGLFRIDFVIRIRIFGSLDDENSATATQSAASAELLTAIYGIDRHVQFYSTVDSPVDAPCLAENAFSDKRLPDRASPLFCISPRMPILFENIKE
jgi:hypothetical protein